MLNRSIVSLLRMSNRTMGIVTTEISMDADFFKLKRWYIFVSCPKTVMWSDTKYVQSRNILKIIAEYSVFGQRWGIFCQSNSNWYRNSIQHSIVATNTTFVNQSLHSTSTNSRLVRIPSPHSCEIKRTSSKQWCDYHWYSWPRLSWPPQLLRPKQQHRVRRLLPRRLLLHLL